MNKVELGKLFSSEYLNYPSDDQKKIREFIRYFMENGFDGLIGKNTNSNNVHPQNPNFINIVAYAHKYKLWHYHIGIPEYVKSKSNSYSTSEYVLHYQLFSAQHIRIVDMSSHNPFSLPSEDYLK